MNILLTGGAGYIGSHVALMLLDNNHNVTIIDNLINGNKKLLPLKANFVNCDISDKKKINFLLRNKEFDAVMHFAAFTRVGESVQDPKKYYKNNYDNAKVFFNECLKNGLNKFIFSSTGAVYGNVKHNNKITESENPKPLNAYSDSKYQLEKYLIELSDQKKIRSIILRYFNVAGADEKKRSGLTTNPDNLIKAVCETAMGKRNLLTINGNDYDTKDGTTIRDFIHVNDLADMHILAAKKIIDHDESGIYNCGYGEGVSIKDVVNEMNSLLKENLNVRFGPKRDGDAAYSVADNSKFVKKFGWEPKYNNLNYILKTALEWEKKMIKNDI